MNKFEELCNRISKAKDYFNDSLRTEEERQKHTPDLHKLLDEIDNKYEHLSADEKPVAEVLLVEVFAG